MYFSKKKMNGKLVLGVIVSVIVIVIILLVVYYLYNNDVFSFVGQSQVKKNVRFLNQNLNDERDFMM